MHNSDPICRYVSVKVMILSTLHVIWPHLPLTTRIVNGEGLWQEPLMSAEVPRVDCVGR